MKVEIKTVHVVQKTKWGEVKKQHGLSNVLVNGKLAGHVPCDEADKNCGVFHPLPQFPREQDAAVISNSGGKLTRSLRDKKAKNEQSVEQAGEPKATA